MMAKKLTKEELDKLDSLGTKEINPISKDVITFKTDIKDKLLTMVMSKELSPIIELYNKLDDVLSKLHDDFKKAVISDIAKIGNINTGLEYALDNLHAALSYYEDMDANASKYNLKHTNDAKDTSDAISKVSKLVLKHDKE